jgi:hypothetical protein
MYTALTMCVKWIEFYPSLPSSDLVYGLDEYHAKVCVQPFPIYSLFNDSISSSAYTVSNDWKRVHKDAKVAMA